jgi:diguanylate cyclase
VTLFYQPGLVVLSVLVAMLAAYSAFDLASRVSSATGRARIDWLVGGAFVLGAGIWSMHFIGMLALDLAIPLGCDVGMTLASMVPAFLGAGAALHLIERKRVSLAQLVLGGVLLGGGIGAMHYMGMAAMRMVPAASYEPTWFTLSIVFAVAAGTLALRIARRAWVTPAAKPAAAVVMGARDRRHALRGHDRVRGAAGQRVRVGLPGAHVAARVQRLARRGVDRNRGDGVVHRT